MCLLLALTPEQVVAPPVEAPKPAPALDATSTGASSEVPIPALTTGQAASSAAPAAPAPAAAAAASATDGKLTTREPPVACEGGPTSPVHAPAAARGEPPVHIKVEVFLVDKAQRDQQVEVKVGVARVRHGLFLLSNVRGTRELGRQMHYDHPPLPRLFPVSEGWHHCPRRHWWYP